MNRSCWLLAAAIVTSCGGTEQDRVRVRLYVAGQDSTESAAASGVTLTLDRADLAFGPLYLCPGYQAGELCDTARLEWLDSVVVDALDPDAQRAGTLSGTSGQVHSFMYDLGLSSQLAAPQPLVLEAARELGGVSLRLEGSADVDGQVLPFRAAIAVQQGEATEHGVPVVRKSATESFDHEVEPGESGLLVRFDPAAWLGQVNFHAYTEDAGCEPSGPEVVCNGAIEQTCDSDARVSESRDCADLGMACQARIGCVEALEIEPGTEAFRSIHNSLTSGERPDFEWGFSP